jgi:alpha-tubulin suppressor-like RCC1 family protein
VDLGGATAFQLTTGAHHTCVLLTSDKARCWGRNDSGQLGYGHTRNIGDDEPPSSAGDIQVFTP